MPFNIQDLKESNEFLTILTESLSSAVFIVDKGLRVQGVNPQSGAMFNTIAESMMDELCGNAINCINVESSGLDCGSAPGCSECNLRGSILRTFMEKVPTDKALICREFIADGSRFLKYFQFSTRYIQYHREEMVLIIIDDITSQQEQKVKLEAFNRELAGINKMIRNNLEMAKIIQLGLIPVNFPSSEHFQISGVYIPVEELGGDFYDLFQPSAGQLSFFISDVSGHGVSSALLATLQKPLIENYQHNGFAPDIILSNLNRALYRFMEKEGYFLTAACGKIDLSNMTLQYGNAAHPEIIILKKDKTVKLISEEKKDFMIGLFLNTDYHTYSEKLGKGDKIILVTDGAYEILNEKNDLYGISRFVETLRQYADQPPREMIKRIIESISDFSRDCKPEDDMTIVIIEIS
jgi:phosphoserine phosphatase RsbU/P